MTLCCDEIRTYHLTTNDQYIFRKTKHDDSSKVAETLRHIRLCKIWVRQWGHIFVIE